MTVVGRCVLDVRSVGVIWRKPAINSCAIAMVIRQDVLIAITKKPVRAIGLPVVGDFEVKFPAPPAAIYDDKPLAVQ